MDAIDHGIRSVLVADLIARHAPGAVMSDPGASDLGVPVVTS
ncbi:MAG: hypothetical protein ACOC6J_03950 [Spirochaetota bacterium]